MSVDVMGLEMNTGFFRATYSETFAGARNNVRSHVDATRYSDKNDDISDEEEV